MKRLPDAAIPKVRARKLRRLSPPATLDLRGGLRGGTLSAATGVDPRRLPELSPLPKPVATTLSLRGRPTGMAALDGRLYITTLDGESGFLHCFRDGALTACVEYQPIGGADEVREIV